MFAFVVLVALVCLLLVVVLLFVLCCLCCCCLRFVCDLVCALPCCGWLCFGVLFCTVLGFYVVGSFVAFGLLRLSWCLCC